MPDPVLKERNVGTPDVWALITVSDQKVDSSSYAVLWKDNLSPYRRKSFHVCEVAGVAIETVSLEYSNEGLGDNVHWAAFPGSTQSIVATGSVAYTTDVQAHYWRLRGTKTGSATASVSIYISCNTR